jgi:pyruvate ferredoxin oxidoreductase alpha subunit
MAEAMRQINPDVVAAYPITPATEIVQIFSSFVADGLVDTEFVPCESEHSAISACVSASAAGARVMTGTSSQGLALMHEILYIAAGLRAPIVICEVNRTLSSPINIHCDHLDTMGSREAGYIQISSEDSQDAYDSVIQAVKIAESVLLPCIVSTDAFIISHCMQRLETLEDKQVQDFIGPYTPTYSLFEKPVTVGPLDLQDYYFEHKRQQIEAMHDSPPALEKVMQEFAQKFGRKWSLIEPYKIEGAEHILMACGSTCGTARVAIDELRAKGVKVGLLKLRVMRPFPYKQLKSVLQNCKFITVLDRSDTLSTMGGPICVELRSALYDLPNKPQIANYIYGLGGRDIDVEQIISAVINSEKIRTSGEQFNNPVGYIGIRE